MNPHQIRLLLVAGKDADFSAVAEVPLLQAVAHNELAAALEAGADEQFDALLLDAALAPSLRSIQQIAAANPRLPLILVAADPRQEELALAALDHGADDYLMHGELTAIALCGALRNARRGRRLWLERNEARDALQRLARRTQGLSPHLAEQLRAAAATVHGLAQAVQQQAAIGEPSRDMLADLVDEAQSSRLLAEDLADAGKIADGRLVLHRRQVRLGEIAGAVADTLRNSRLPAPLTVEDAANWQALVVCDLDKTVRAVSRMAEAVGELLGGPAVVLSADEGGRLTLGIDGRPLSDEQRQLLLDDTPRLPGEAGFERHVALGLLRDQQILVDAGEAAVRLDLPAAPDQLTRRWCRWLTERARPEQDEILLLEVHSPPEVEADVADAYLQHAVTCRDLVLRRSADSWLILLSSGGPQTERRLRQLRLMWDVMAPAAALRIQQHGSCRLPVEQPQLERQVGSLLHGGARRILVLDRHSGRPSPLRQRLCEAGYEVFAADSRQGLADSPLQADAIVGDDDSLSRLQTLPAHVPVFLLTALQNQQRRLEQNVRLVRQDEGGRYDELLDALGGLEGQAPGFRPRGADDRPRAAGNVQASAADR